MKVAIYGVGAVGGLIGARLAVAGCEVGAIARGATLAALQRHGLRLEENGQASAHAVRAVADPAALGEQDLVVIAVKAPGLPTVAASIAPLLGPRTLVMAAMNGVPWWFFANADKPQGGLRLDAIDAGGRLAQAIPLARTLGCVVHLAASCPEPGLVRLAFGNRLLIGAAASMPPARMDEVIASLRRGGVDALESVDIRTDVWYKLWGNLTLNPVSVLTGATADKILDDPLVREFCLAAMAEAAAIGDRIGCHIGQSGQDRLQVARELGAFKTSMLQDAQAGRLLEIDALVTAVHDIGRAVDVPTPAIDSLLGLIRLHARTHGLYPT